MKSSYCMIRFKEILSIDILKESTFPSGWSFNTFEQLKQFSQRKQYCDSLLQKIGQGSGRLVYNIDNAYVLKLAKNKKGLAQNKQEVSFIHDGSLGSSREFFAEIEGADENGFWNIAEHCRKMTSKEFEQKTGIRFKLFTDYMGWGFGPSPPEGFQEFVDSETYGAELFSCIERTSSDFEIPINDWTRLSSYGINKKGNVVIVDYGVNNDVIQTYYSK